MYIRYMAGSEVLNGQSEKYRMQRKWGGGLIRSSTSEVEGGDGQLSAPGWGQA